MTATPSPTPTPTPAPTWNPGPPGMDINESGNLVVHHTLIHAIITLLVAVILLRVMWRILRANWKLIAFCFGVMFLAWWLTTGPEDRDPPFGPYPANTHHTPPPTSPRYHKRHIT